MANTNCLKGMICPKCKEEDSGFRIVATVLIEMTDEGGGDCEGPDWEDNAHCECMDCGYTAEVKDFKIAKGGE